MKKPNIIIFNPDEMRWNTMGHMGNSAAYTPELDRFAKEDAVSFSHAYCQNPVCVPSRCSFTTGLYPHTNGHRTMRYLMHEQETTVFKELKDAGYHVWMNSRNDVVAGQIEGLVESHADEIYYYSDDRTKKKVQNRKTEEENEFPYSHFTGVVEDGTGDGRDIGDVKAAIERIKNPLNDKPLCIFLGLMNPHPPYEIEKKYYEQIQKDQMSKRISLDDCTNKSTIMSEILQYSGMRAYAEEQWDELRAVYLAQCAFIDDLFGQICNALKEAGEYDNSAIFVLSDHGDYAGDYDLVEKAQNSFEDCLTRVPLLIKPPKTETVDPGIASGIVELVDFYATVMDYAGVEPSHDHFGKTFRPMIENREEKVRTYAFSEGGRLAHEIQCDEFHANGPQGMPETSEYWARTKAQCNSLAHEKGTMITDGNYKFVKRLSGNHEFYDLKKDPHECNNIYEQEKHSEIVMDMKEAMLNWYQETCDVVPRTYDRRFSDEGMWLMVRNFCRPEEEEAVRRFIKTGEGVQQCFTFIRELRKQKGNK